MWNDMNGCQSSPVRSAVLNESERLAWLMLARVPRLGTPSFWQLISHFDTATTALKNLPSRWQVNQKTLQKNCLNELEKVIQYGARLILPPEESYPPLLKEIGDPPPVLSCIGNEFTSTTPIVSIVGGRNASLNGQRFAQQLAVALSRSQVTVVSGMARGIDSAAHTGCLAAGSPYAPTIAVVAGGIDIIYPSENKTLYQAIQERGAIISEMPMGCTPIPQLFPRRNRIIAAISQATIVIEAALQSGSLITARHAIQYAREVMAVPGFPSDSRHHGSNSLLRQGALLIESADDVLAALPHIKTTPAPSQESGLERMVFDATLPADLLALKKQILSLLSAEPISIEKIIAQIGEPVSLIQSILLDLELSGEINRYAGNISRLYGIKN